MKHLALLVAAAAACLAQGQSNADSPQIGMLFVMPLKTRRHYLQIHRIFLEARRRIETHKLTHAVRVNPPEDVDGAPEAAVVRRDGADAAPSGYTPASSSCPDPPPKIRAGSSISPQEKTWLPQRRAETIPHIRKLIKRLAITDFDSDRYFGNLTVNSTALPKIGIAISGGGYRAMVGGAGAVAAWDARSAGSEEKGSLGGLLQSSTYISGLSGGDWLVGSLFINNFISVQNAIDAPLIWQLENSIFTGRHHIDMLYQHSPSPC